MGTDGSVVMVGTAQDESTDFAAVKLDKDGNLLWEWQVTKTNVLRMVTLGGWMSCVAAVPNTRCSTWYIIAPGLVLSV